MTVTVPVSLSPEEQSALLARAQAEGVSVDSLLRKAVLQVIAAPPAPADEQLPGEQWEREFEDWLDDLPDVPSLSDEAISRETIYTREDECL
jgi:hypothetical protein